MVMMLLMVMEVMMVVLLMNEANGCGDGDRGDDHYGDDCDDLDVHGLGGQRAVLDPRSTWASKTRRTKSAQGSKSR